MVDKIIKRIAGWKGKLLSYAGRLVLIKTCLSSIPVYLMSFFKFPKWALELINSHLANFLWNDFEGHGKIHLANWDMVCMQKEHGGLRVPNLRDLNMVLLGSWIKRFLKGENKLWYEIVKEKYTRNAVNIFCLPHAPSSQFWKGIIWAVKALKFGYRWQIGDGVKIRFWEDIWFRNSPLAVQFWDLYCICDQIGKSIAEVWDEQEVKLTFRTFSQTMWERWLELVEVVSSIRYTSDGDALIWAYESRGEYTIKSLYAVINFRGVQPVFVPAVWKIVVPPSNTGLSLAVGQQ